MGEINRTMKMGDQKKSGKKQQSMKPRTTAVLALGRKSKGGGVPKILGRYAASKNDHKAPKKKPSEKRKGGRKKHMAGKDVVLRVC